MNTTATYSSEHSWSRRCSTETVFSIQGQETDYVRDTSDTEFENDGDGDGARQEDVEYEPASETDCDDAPVDCGDSSGESDNEIITTKVIAVSVGDDGDVQFADAEQTESGGEDSELDLHDYWRCVQCQARNNNPLYRYCEKCYKVRKDFFPPRPKRKRRRNAVCDSIPRTLSQDSGVCSQELSQNDAGNQAYSQKYTGHELDQFTVGSQESRQKGWVASNEFSQDDIGSQEFSQNGTGSQANSQMNRVAGHEFSQIDIGSQEFSHNGLGSQVSQNDRAGSHPFGDNFSAASEKLSQNDTGSQKFSQNDIGSQKFSDIPGSSTIDDRLTDNSTGKPRKRRSESADRSTKRLKIRTDSDSDSSTIDVKPLVKTISDPSITIDEPIKLTKKVISNSLKNKIDNDNMCIICFSEPKSGVFVHGRIAHICCCYKCAMKVWAKAKRCPVCNCKVSNVLKAVVM